MEPQAAGSEEPERVGSIQGSIQRPRYIRTARCAAKVRSSSNGGNWRTGHKEHRDHKIEAKGGSEIRNPKCEGRNQHGTRAWSGERSQGSAGDSLPGTQGTSSAEPRSTLRVGAGWPDRLLTRALCGCGAGETGRFGGGREVRKRGAESAEPGAQSGPSAADSKSRSEIRNPKCEGRINTGRGAGSGERSQGSAGDSPSRGLRGQARRSLAPPCGLERDVRTAC